MGMIIDICKGAFYGWLYLLKFVLSFLVVASPVWLLILVSDLLDSRMRKLMKDTDKEMDEICAKLHGKTIMPTPACFEGSAKRIITDVPNDWSPSKEL